MYQNVRKPNPELFCDVCKAIHDNKVGEAEAKAAAKDAGSKRKLVQSTLSSRTTPVPTAAETALVNKVLLEMLIMCNVPFAIPV